MSLKWLTKFFRPLFRLNAITPRMKKPRRIDLARSCYYALPSNLAAKELSEYEIYMRAQYTGILHSRSGSIYFFELPTVSARDAFLASMEISARQAGIVVERGWLAFD